MNHFIALAAAALVFAPAAFAQTNDAPQSDIVVTGVRPEQIQTFVEQVSAVPPSVDQLARWDEDICLAVAGLPRSVKKRSRPLSKHRVRFVGGM